jgi:hypothetical protein
MYLYLINDPVSWEHRSIARVNLDGTGFEILREFQDVGDGFAFDLFIR